MKRIYRMENEKASQVLPVRLPSNRVFKLAKIHFMLKAVFPLFTINKYSPAGIFEKSGVLLKVYSVSLDSPTTVPSASNIVKDVLFYL